jgi:hypothetical protein
MNLVSKAGGAVMIWGVTVVSGCCFVLLEGLETTVGGWEDENKPQQILWLIFHDTSNGPPIFWVPLHVSPSSTPPSSDDVLPTSLWKEEGLWLGSVVGC